jgi:hypothetical protein
MPPTPFVLFTLETGSCFFAQASLNWDPPILGLPTIAKITGKIYFDSQVHKF